MTKTRFEGAGDESTGGGGAEGEGDQASLELLCLLLTPAPNHDTSSTGGGKGPEWSPIPPRTPQSKPSGSERDLS